MDDKSKRPHLVLPKLPPRSNTISSGSSNNNNSERPQPPIPLPRLPTRAGTQVSSISKDKRNSMSGGAPISPNRVLPPILPDKPKLKATGFDTSEGANDVTNKLERKFSDIPQPQSSRVDTIQKQSSENFLSRSTELNLSNLETILNEKKKILAQKSVSTPPPDDAQREKEEIGEKVVIRKKERLSKSKSKDEENTQKRHRRTLSSGESAIFAVNKPTANAIISQMQKMKIKTDIEIPLETPKGDNNNDNNNNNNVSIVIKEKESKDKDKDKDKERELREREDKSRGLVTSLGGIGGGVMDIVKQGASMPGHAASEISKKTSRFASKIMGAVSTNNPSSSPDQNARSSPYYYYGSKTVEELLSGDDLLQSKEIATSFLLTQLLELIGLNENQSQDVFEKIMQFIPNEYISSYTNREISNLENIITGSQKIVKKHAEAKHIVKIQSLCRGFLLRRRVKKIVSGDIKGRVQFNRTFALFIEREEHYIKNLKLLIDRFLTPVRAKISAGKEIIKLEDMSFIFCNVEIILEIHQKNLRRLKALLDDWPFIKGVGKAILEIGSSLQAYGIYVGNFKNAQDTVIRLKAEKNSKFNGWVQEVAQKHQDGYDLLTLISLPVNHIAKMEPLLEQLASLAVGYDQIEVENLNNASSMIRETSKFVTQNLLHSDNTAVITNVQRRITGYFKPLNLIKPDRKFMMETQFTTLADKKKIYLFLFNDILLVTIPQKNLFKFKDIVLLDLVQFEDMKSEKNAFILKTPNEILKLVAKTSEDKQQWVKILSSLEESRKVNRTIGVGIQEILDRESSQSPRDGAKEIPSILTQCIEYIEQNDGINTEGLFRISGDQREVNSLVDLFDTMVEPERDLSSFSIHSVCSVLKLWFRELPEPLLTFSFYDKLVDIERKTSDDDDRGITQFRDTIRTLPKSNICSLKFLLDFLGKVCHNSNVNKMTTNNMAIVFGPTLLRPLTETIETTLNSPIVNRIVQIFIEKFDELFE